MQGNDNHPPRSGLIQNVPPEDLRRNVTEVLQTLQQNTYRDQPPARLVAVTKTVAPAVINDLKAFQINDIGENRVQVALPKLSQIDPEFRLHWIGRLQTNKVKDIIDKVWMLHSLDRLSLAEEVERRASQRGLTIPALVQVNIAQETQKAGLSLEEVRPFLDQVRHFEHLRISGLMAIMPFTDDEHQLTAYFRGMRALFDQLRAEAMDNIHMEELSMGMSHDFAIAAREGATMVRVGTALYRTR